MALTIGIVFTILGATLCYDVRTNQYFDTMLRSSYQTELRAAGLDPARLNNITTLDKDKVLRISTNVNTTYYNGYLHGLSGIYRWGDCSNLYYRNGNRALNCSLYFPNLEISYDAHIKYGITPMVTIHNKGNVTNMIMFLEVVAPPTGGPARVNTFAVTSMPTPRVTYTGLGPLNRSVANILEKSYIAGLNPQLNFVTNVQLRHVLDRSIPSVLFPV